LRPLWTRAALNDLPPVPAPEKGAYGAPTRRDGQKLELEQWDVPVSSPLSIALHAAADGSMARVATADYRGWLRQAGLVERSYLDLTSQVLRTWDICQRRCRECRGCRHRACAWRRAASV